VNLRDALLLALCYGLGSIPFGYLLARAKAGVDIREHGSGNTGATNVLRTQGKALGALTLLLDFAKAAASVWICRAWGSAPWMDAAGGAAAVVGHCFPFCLGFRGGKGIASGIGAFVFIAPVPTLAALGVFILEVATLRWVSLGSILASITFGLATVGCHMAFGWYDPVSSIVAAGLALLLVARHRSNIRNLLAGTEPKAWGAGSWREGAAR
jgi:acyl phosphate:glycerol-3-phosphate acyltransferase